jgi:hypothetical protein
VILGGGRSFTDHYTPLSPWPKPKDTLR